MWLIADGGHGVGFGRGTVSVRGDTVESFPADEEQGVRVEMWGNEIERISKINVLTGEAIVVLERAAVYPAKHCVPARPPLERAVRVIREELVERLAEMRGNGRLLEAQRLESRTNFDIEMMLEVGTCAGIENYSRHLSGRQAGERPSCLFDFFPEDFLVVVDESHVSLPQIGGMFNGDRARKLTLVDYGFRLPSALDNRPLMFDEFLKLTPPPLLVSPSPGQLVLKVSQGVAVDRRVERVGAPEPERIDRLHVVMSVHEDDRGIAVVAAPFGEDCGQPGGRPDLGSGESRSAQCRGEPGGAFGDIDMVIARDAYAGNPHPLLLIAGYL